METSEAPNRNTMSVNDIRALERPAAIALPRKKLQVCKYLRSRRLASEERRRLVSPRRGTCRTDGRGKRLLGASAESRYLTDRPRAFATERRS